MGEKNLWSKLGLIVLLAGMCAWQVWPPEKKLKPGIDLGGGHSLLLAVDDSGLQAAQKRGLAGRVMAILKQRVDPQGNRNLIWRPIGWNRIEIQMPRPPDSQLEHRAAYEKARSELLETQISEYQIRRALTLEPEQRDQAFEQMVGAVASRQTIFEKLSAADDKYRQLQSATTQPADSQLAQKTDEAFLQRRALIEEVLATNLDVRVLEDILKLDAKSQVRIDKLEDVKTDHADLVPLIDSLLAGFEEWAKAKGALDDPTDLMRMLRGAGKLEFRILAQPDPSNPSRTVSGEPQYREEIQKYIDQLEKFGPRPREGDYFAWFEIANPDEPGSIADPKFASSYIVSEYLGTKYVLTHSTDDMGLLNTGDETWKLRGAYTGSDQQGRPAVNFELDARGGKKFGRMTRNNIGRPLCIFLDNKAMSSATIRSEITTRGQISGNFSQTEVANLINTLNAGVLPARLKETPLQQKSVGPALGKTNRDRGMQAIAVAFTLSIVFMALYYTYNGVIADIALLLNLVITLGIMSFLQATFTLPGIAGLVLMLGMAVDANVLIYERIREELNAGVSVRMAVKLGYERAFSAILDSNVTTIITAVILGSLGSEEIKGFGLTLGIGLCTSMFTALFVTRQYFNIMIPTNLNREEMGRSWLGTGILLVAGAVFMGLGYLFNRGPEEVLADSRLFGFGKFFGVMFATAAILMLSLWAFRLMYRITGQQKANRLPMMRLFTAPNINWMGKYKGFWTFSAIVIIAGFLFEANVNKSQYLDIEFLGGTSVQVQVKDALADEFSEEGDEKLLNEYIRGEGENESATTSVGWLSQAATQLENATVTLQGEDRYQIATSAPYSLAQMEALLTPVFDDYIVRGGIKAAEKGALVQLDYDKIKGKLFEMDASLVDDLENGNNSDALRARFATEGVTISPEALVAQTDTGRVWLIDDNGTRYAISHKDEDTLVVDRLMGLGSVQAKLGEAAQYVNASADKLRNARVQEIVERIASGQERRAFEIITTESQQSLVAEALLASMSDVLEVSQPIEGKLVRDPDLAPEGYYPIKQADNVLSDVIGGNNTASIVELKTGVLFVFDDLNPAPTTAEVRQRLRDMRLQPDFEDLSSRDKIAIIGLDPVAQEDQANEPRYSRIAIATVDPSLPYIEGDENITWRTEVAAKELKLAQAALASSRTLQRVTQFAAQVAGEAVQKAIIAIILSMIAIAGYLWIRFGSIEFGLAGIIALYHDVAVTLTCVMACHHIHDTAIGQMLMLSDFRIDLAMIAAFLTIVGYSINDTIVIFDRIRENRGRLATVSASLVNNSINQTLSRTLITSLTTMIAVLAMYVVGGEGIHGFAFAIIVGVISGTYSTIAIATPMLQHPRAMWVVVITLATLTSLLIVATVPIQGVRYTLMAIIAVVAVAALVRQWSITATSVRRHATV